MCRVGICAKRLFLSLRRDLTWCKIVRIQFFSFWWLRSLTLPGSLERNILGIQCLERCVGYWSKTYFGVELSVGERCDVGGGHGVLYYGASKGMIRSSTVRWLVWFGNVVMIHIVYWCGCFGSHWALSAPTLQKYYLWENSPTQCVSVVHRRGRWLQCGMCKGGDLWIDGRIGSRNSSSAKYLLRYFAYVRCSRNDPSLWPIGSTRR